MKPIANEILKDSEFIGEKIKILNETYNNIIKKNPYEINIVRLYAFVLDKIYLMKKTASDCKVKLNKNIRYYLLNDRKNEKNENNNNNENNIEINNNENNNKWGGILKWVKRVLEIYF